MVIARLLSLLLLLVATSSPSWAQTASQQIGSTAGTPAQKLQSLLGLIVFGALCAVYGQWANKGKTKIPWRTVIFGTALQFAFAILVLNSPAFFTGINDAVSALLSFSNKGSEFVFGKLIYNNVPIGVPGDGFKPMAQLQLDGSYANTGAFFAFSVLPTIIFFSSLSTLLYHSGIMGYVIGGIAWVMQRSMKTSGAETLSSAANIFLGQTEAPLLVKPFISKATQSELMAIMTGGFANIASGVLAAYVGMLSGFVPTIAGHLVAASLISAPCAMVVAKLLIPESEEPVTGGEIRFKLEKVDANAVDAAARGALEGAQLAFNVGAMLLAFIALVAMFNALIGYVGGLFGFHGLSMESILGVLLSPFAWLTGVPWKDASAVGALVGVKTVVNEFKAYLDLSLALGTNVHYIDARSVIIASYALCGFANFSSIAIQIGGIGGMAPERRHDLSKLGLISMIGGGISSLMTACVVGILL